MEATDEIYASIKSTHVLLRGVLIIAARGKYRRRTSRGGNFGFTKSALSASGERPHYPIFPVDRVFDSTHQNWLGSALR